MIDRSNIKYHEFEQTSEEWHRVRRGKFTGSTAHVLFVGDGLGAGAMTAIYKNVAELVTNEDQSDFTGNLHTDRGLSYESVVRELYEEMTWESVKQYGFIELNEFIGYSPDGLVGEDGLIEIKCPAPKEFVRVSLERKIDNQYVAQMQFGMWVTGRKWCDNIYYNPQFFNPLLIIRVVRDEFDMKTLDKKANLLIEKMNEILNKIK